VGRPENGTVRGRAQDVREGRPRLARGERRPVKFAHVYLGGSGTVAMIGEKPRANLAAVSAATAETFFLKIGDATNAAVADGSGKATIVDDD
jgi:hypothetical protein